MYQSWTKRDKTLFRKAHYIKAAQLVQVADTQAHKDQLTYAYLILFRSDNPLFNEDRFLQECRIEQTTEN